MALKVDGDWKYVTLQLFKQDRTLVRKRSYRS
jgi:hypothetical protein